MINKIKRDFQPVQNNKNMGIAIGLKHAHLILTNDSTNNTFSFKWVTLILMAKC